MRLRRGVLSGEVICRQQRRRLRLRQEQRLHHGLVQHLHADGYSHTYPNPHCYPDGDSNRNTHGYSDSHGDCYSDLHADGYSHSYGDPDGYSDAYSNAHPNPHGYTDGNGDTYTSSRDG